MKGTTVDLRAATPTLMGIPPELRLKILQNLLKSPVELPVKRYQTEVWHDHVEHKHIYCKDTPEDREPDLWALSSQILRCCKKLFEEGTEILYKENRVTVALSMDKQVPGMWKTPISGFIDARCLNRPTVRNTFWFDHVDWVEDPQWQAEIQFLQKFSKLRLTINAASHLDMRSICWQVKSLCEGKDIVVAPAMHAGTHPLWEGGYAVHVVGCGPDVLRCKSAAFLLERTSLVDCSLSEVNPRKTEMIYERLLQLMTSKQPQSNMTARLLNAIDEANGVCAAPVTKSHLPMNMLWASPYQAFPLIFDQLIIAVMSDNGEKFQKAKEQLADTLDLYLDYIEQEAIYAIQEPKAFGSPANVQWLREELIQVIDMGAAAKVVQAYRRRVRQAELLNRAVDDEVALLRAQCAACRKRLPAIKQYLREV